ncbi:hypothetical protein RCL_jg21892.t2 [Rhizophagus clarus]|nr:hypothetical protein RCL_jg21892.t2 [Rhizophagus clarus]
MKLCANEYRYDQEKSKRLMVDYDYVYENILILHSHSRNPKTLFALQKTTSLEYQPARELISDEYEKMKAG